MIIKTFVTTDLQKAIAEKFGLRCVETLTGFKYIGAKLEKYERAVPLPAGDDYRDLPEEETRRLRLAHSSFYIFGGEESYGYSGADFVGTKTATARRSCFARSRPTRNRSASRSTDCSTRFMREFGYYLEKNGALTFEGAEGAAKIQRLLATYVSNPPNEMLGSKVIGDAEFRNRYHPRCRGRRDPAGKDADLRTGGQDARGGAWFRHGAEDQVLPLRPASTGVGRSSRARSSKTIKPQVGAKLEALWAWLQEDAASRIGSA